MCDGAEVGLHQRPKAMAVFSAYRLRFPITMDGAIRTAATVALHATVAKPRLQLTGGRSRPGGNRCVGD